MNDPHIESLRYRLEPSKDVTFQNPTPVMLDTSTFRLRLEQNVLCIELKDHYASEEDARGMIEGYLRAWEMDAALKFGKGDISFVFEGSRIIDRRPSPPGTPQIVEASAELRGSASVTAAAHTIRRTYPTPPTRLKVSPDVETIWHRFDGYLSNREPLPGMAYFCLSLLEGSAGGRNKAAKKYNIELAVLDKLGELTSTRGDTTEARKLNRGAPLVPLTVNERTWIVEAIKALIRRKAEYDFDPTCPLSRITIGDLPKI